MLLTLYKAYCSVQNCASCYDIKNMKKNQVAATLFFTLALPFKNVYIFFSYFLRCSSYAVCQYLLFDLQRLLEIDILLSVSLDCFSYNFVSIFVMVDSMIS